MSQKVSRKTTVLIAALVNSVFLVALFSTAIRSNESDSHMMSPQLHAEAKPPPELSTDGAGYKGSEKSSPALELPSSLSSPLLSDVPDLGSNEPLATQAAKRVEPLKKDSEKSSASPVRKSESDYIEIEVKKGDVLERIARANGTSVATLMEINHLKSPWLKIGQKLRVPRQSAPSAKRGAKESSISSSPEFYTVKKGDNLWIIASKFKVKVSELKRLNHLDDESAKRLKVNDQLRIR